MNHIKVFKNRDEYLAFIANVDFNNIPSMCFCKEENEVYMLGDMDPYNEHEYVEIGGLKWATKNVGASSITDVGLYFQWGGVEGVCLNDCENGKRSFMDGAPYYATDSATSTSGFTKYNSRDRKIVLDFTDDAARMVMGGLWRTPTVDEWKSLKDACFSNFITNYQGSGVNGLLLSDKKDSSKTLFFPYGGTLNTGLLIGKNNYGYFYANSRDASYDNSAWCVYFHNNSIDMDVFTRSNGKNVRGVISVK